MTLEEKVAQKIWAQVNPAVVALRRVLRVLPVTSCYNQAVDLNLRGVPDELAEKLRKKAALSGKTLRDFCTGILESAVDEGVQVTCPMCGMEGPLIRMGTNARCFHCGSGFVPPEG